MAIFKASLIVKKEYLVKVEANDAAQAQLKLYTLDPSKVGVLIGNEEVEVYDFERVLGGSDA